LKALQKLRIGSIKTCFNISFISLLKKLFETVTKTASFIECNVLKEKETKVLQVVEETRYE
jgi:hypothetical protein